MSNTYTDLLKKRNHAGGKSVNYSLSDECYTPSDQVLPLLEYLDKDKTYYEPTSGKSSLIVDGFDKNEYKIVPSNGKDFFDCGPDDVYDGIITNPPYSIKDKFIEHCYSLGKPFALLLTSNFATSAEKWDMALAYGASNFHSANATEFAKNVSDKSGGKLTIVTHPGGSLYKGGEIFRAVRTGQAQIGERFMSALGKEDPLLEIDSQPFLASSYDDAMKLYMASKPEIVKGLDSKGLVFLYAVPWPAQGLYSKKEINSKADLKGLKFRAYNSSLIRLAELTGMAPTKIEAAEISQAFSTGAVESMITSPTTGKNSKIWENGVKYFYDIAAWYPKNMIIVNKDAWSKLDSATQKLVMSEAAIAEKKGWDLSKKGNTADKKALADAGMTVGKVNSALNNHFKEVGSKMSKEWASRAGSRGQSVLAAYK